MKDKSQPGRARRGVAVLSYFALSAFAAPFSSPQAPYLGLGAPRGKKARAAWRHSSPQCGLSLPRAPQHPLSAPAPVGPPAGGPRPPRPPRPPVRPPRAPPAGGRWRRGGDKRGRPGPPGLPSAVSAKRPPLPSRASNLAAAQAPERAGLRADLGLPASCRAYIVPGRNSVAARPQLGGGSAVDWGQPRVAPAASLPAQDPRGARRARSPPPRWGWGAAGRPAPQLCH